MALCSRAVTLAEAAIDRVLSLSELQIGEIGATTKDTISQELDPERIAAIRLRYYEDAIANFKPKPAAVDDWSREPAGP